jgi:hypothetical protein
MNLQRVLLVALCGMSLIPSAAALEAQGRRVTPLPDKLNAATRMTIERLADSLGAEQLPSNALRDKAAEGVLKGANDAAIVSAVRSLAQRLRVARSAMGPTTSEDELLAGAAVLYAGVTPDALSRFSAVQRKRSDARFSLTVPLVIVAHLTNSSVPGEMALSSVESLLSRGARDADLGAFRVSVERDLQNGRSLKDALDAGLRTTLRGIGRDR